MCVCVCVRALMFRQHRQQSKKPPSRNSCDKSSKSFEAAKATTAGVLSRLPPADNHEMCKTAGVKTWVQSEPNIQCSEKVFAFLILGAYLSHLHVSSHTFLVFGKNQPQKIKITVLKWSIRLLREKSYRNPPAPVRKGKCLLNLMVGCAILDSRNEAYAL